jgi:nitroimidazol reductase NimA-like FMN-containing flavoprotein (pyridoxamine 5'-phosphate oxidase superfamily)
VRLRKAEAQFIQWERVCRAATADLTGAPHAVPVCHVLIDGKVYFATGAGAKKLQNLQANPWIALAFDLYSDAWESLKGVMLQGRATLIEKGPRFRKVRNALYRKYPQYPVEAALEEGDSVIVEVTPTRVFSWGFDD